MTTPLEATESPFGQPAAGWRRAVRLSLLAGLPVLAGVAAYLGTRGHDGAAAADMAGHDHGAMLTADTPQPVMLSARDADRIGVTFATATVAPIRREIRTVGLVRFDETRVKAVSLKIDGWVERLHVDFTGQDVRAGQPLMAVYSPMLVAAQEELLLAARLQRDMAAGSVDARAGATELLASARQRLAYWDVGADEVRRIEAAGAVQRTLTLRAPVSGFVVEKNVLEGQRVMAGEALYRIADLGTVWIEGDVFEQDLPLVQLGQSVVAELQARPGEEFRGRITYVYPTIDPDAHTARVRVELPNAGLRLKPGMYATLRIAGAARTTLSVPRTAVLSTGDRHIVFLRRSNGMLEPTAVRVGIATADRIEIIGGLAAGDTVVASATFLVDAESNLGTSLRPPAAADDHSRH